MRCSDFLPLLLAGRLWNNQPASARISDRAFAASLDIGDTAEFRIRKSNEDGGGTSFADYVWKPSCSSK